MNARRFLLAFGFAVAVAALPHGARAEDSLFQDLGARPGLIALTDDLMTRLLEDPRMRPFFQDVDQAKLKASLVEQFCEVSGGPCKYTGKDMKTAHAGQDVTRSNFNALVEVLQQSMDAQGIAFRVQNRLLARLAPMYRDVVNAP